MATTALGEFEGTLASRTSVKEETALYTQTVGMSAGGVSVYTLNDPSVFGSKWSEYDWWSLKVEVFVYDSDSSSPTYQHYVNAEDSVHMGFSSTKVTIKAIEAVSLLVRISARKKPAF